MNSFLEKKIPYLCSNNFTWFFLRKFSLLSISVDFILVFLINIFFFIYAVKFDISNTFLITFFISFGWSLFSYVIGNYPSKSKYNQKGKRNLYLRYLKNFTLSLLLFLFNLSIFFNKNIASFDNIINLLYYTSFVFIFSSVTQFLLVYFHKKLFTKDTFSFYLGSKKSFANLEKFSQISCKPFNLKYLENLNLVSKNSQKIKFIILNDRSFLNNLDQDMLNLIKKSGIKFINEFQWCELFLNRIPSELLIDKNNYNYYSKTNNRRIYFLIKRIGELFLSLFLLILTSPLIIISSLLIFLEDKGTIFYYQIRNCKDGKLFKLIKLRTMSINAEKGGPQWVKKYDPRVTKIGRFLRKTRIDELPQLWLVINGTMSLIGPRPERPEFDDILKEKIPYYLLRQKIKPGLSGWAQVNYPYGASIKDAENKLSYDLYYIKSFSIWLDILILFKTMQLVFNGRGSIPVSKN